MQQIAAAAGVSTTTVSHVLSGKRPVNSATTERIMKIVREANYVPALAAQMLHTGRSSLIGLVVPDITLSYFSAIARGVERAATTRDYGVVISSSAYSPSSHGTRYLNMLRTGMIDGLVYVANNSEDERDAVLSLIDDFPVILACEPMSQMSTVDSVFSDNVLGAELAARHLAQLGHDRVVVIAGPESLMSSRDRVKGAKSVFPHALVLYGNFNRASGADLARDLHLSGAPFTALICGNDEIALGAISWLTSAGIRVPEEVSVVGFDDIEISAQVTPALTTVRQPAEQMGEIAAERLIARIDSPSESTQIPVLLPVELVVRATTAPPHDH